MSSSTETKFTLDELIALSEQCRAEHREKYPDNSLSPFELLCAMSAHFLAAYFPEHKDALLDGDHHQLCSTFALEMLRLHDLPATMWLSEERQEATYGGMEPMLFDILPEGIIEHYGKAFGRNRQNDDPMTWDTTEL